MYTKQVIGTNLDYLMDMLATNDGMIRQKAKASLVALGRPAASSLSRALQNSKSNQVRWDAAEALGAIGDTKSIPSLVRALADEDSDATWLAAKALSNFKTTAWPPSPRVLMTSGPTSELLYQGAHQVPLNQKDIGFNDLLATLMTASERRALSESAIIAASDILERMKA